MEEITAYEEVYGNRTSTNRNAEWFGTVTSRHVDRPGRHLYHPSPVDFNTPCYSNSEGQQLYNFNKENCNEIIQNNR